MGRERRFAPYLVNPGAKGSSLLQRETGGAPTGLPGKNCRGCVPPLQKRPDSRPNGRGATVLQRRPAAGVTLLQPAGAGGGEHLLGAEAARGIERQSEPLHRRK